MAVAGGRDRGGWLRAREGRLQLGRKNAASDSTCARRLGPGSGGAPIADLGFWAVAEPDGRRTPPRPGASSISHRVTHFDAGPPLGLRNRKVLRMFHAEPAR